MARFCLPLSLTVALSVAPARAADLLQIYRDALANDATYASARAARDSGLENLPQGLAQILPTINATGFAQSNNVDIKFREIGGVPAAPESRRQGTTSGLTVTLTQPLFNWQSFQAYKEAGFKAAQAEATFGQATQDLIVRVAQAYFDVLASQDSLAFIQGQKVAIAEQLAQAKRNFEVGTATITDTHEAQARFDLATSQEIAAQSDLEIKKRTLQQIVGRFPERLEPLKPSIELSPPKPNSMEDWASAASSQSYPVRAQEAAVEVALREIDRVRAGHLPTLNIVGNAGVSSSGLSTTATVNSASDTTNYNIGLQLAIPLYAGGNVSSLVRQAVANREKAQQDLESTRRTAALSARQAYVGVTNGMAQVKALEAALVSSRSALDSNKLGYEVGVRINIDVLNAQQQVFSTLRDLSRARYDTILNGLRLKAASGTLGEPDVEEINRLLGSG
ncbi:MAG: TolC family outer membrane protein [Betaproteobacteria bacterium]|jgi:outer membrane protein|nr:MAG: TolC family outer membrane protein [Betaproteobacteria bacterium]TMH83145.1 MAG: TolC family outer membrane protein [Betaproteobacteria bacterium]